jgi:hypothetical protein
MVSVDVMTAPAVIPFASILEKTTVVYDNHETMTPWENCDGFEHKAVKESSLVGRPRDMQGAVHCQDGRVVIILNDDDLGLYDYLRERGASKQVAREAVAADRQGRLRQLRNWYANGWEWYGVKCDFRILGDHYDASVWGFDSEEFAGSEREEVAYEVVAQLEKDGFTVTGKPEPPKRLTARQWTTIVSGQGIRQDYSPHAMTPEAWHEGYKRDMAMQNWKG